MTAEEPIGLTMARIDAQAGLLMTRPCPTCDADVSVAARNASGLPVALGVRHQPECVEFSADW